jgi:Xaa-Pro aminopeptidase
VFGEDLRAERLLDAQDKAAELFVAVEQRGLIRPGVGERQVSDEIRDLAAELFGVSRHWHKRIVHGGENTLATARDNPPDRVIADDDIVFVDLGPIFEEWEADFGRTYVLGDDPRKLALRDELPRVWEAGQAYFDAHPDITGAQLFVHMMRLSRAAGWEFGGAIAGHLVGEFPHEKIDGREVESYVALGSDLPMRRMDSAGRQCHWILEVHLVDPDRRFGGFHEELLDLRRSV